METDASSILVNNTEGETTKPIESAAKPENKVFSFASWAETLKQTPKVRAFIAQISLSMFM